MDNIKKAAQLLTRIERAHEAAIDAIDSYGRSAEKGNNSDTTARHYERYEKHMALFNLSVKELRARLLDALPGAALQSTSKEENHG